MKKKIERVFAKNFARNYEKNIILGTSDPWLTSHLFQPTSKPVYYIVDCRIYKSHAYSRTRGHKLYSSLR